MSYRENSATIELAFIAAFPSTELPQEKFLRSWNTLDNILDTLPEVARYCTKKGITDVVTVGKIVTSALHRNQARIAARDGDPLPFPNAPACDPFARQAEEV